MKRILAVLVLLVSHELHAAAGGGYQEMFISKARAAGMAYQFSARCGADEKLLNQYLAKYKTQTRTESLHQFPELNIDAEFQVGVDEAMRFYDSVKDASYRAMVCNQMTQQMQRELASPL